VKKLLGAVALAVGAVPAVAGVASAAELPPTQPPLQGVDAGIATAQTAVASLVDGLNGPDRAVGVDGLASEFMTFDPRYVEGPLGGLLKNGPFA
jgi:hypothetical protein